MTFKTFLAPNDDPMKNLKFFDLVQFPTLASPKLDGIRTNIRNGRVLSRTLKDLPNKLLVETFGEFHGLDGEFIVGSPTDEAVYNKTHRVIMKKKEARSIDDVTLYVFDTNEDEYKDKPFSVRYERAKVLVARCNHPQVVLVRHTVIDNLEQLEEFEEVILAKGYEGIMGRSLDGPYKYGRATMNHGFLFKLKRFTDVEVVVLELVEQMTNTNEKTTNELGRSQRSSHKAGMVPANTLGRFIVAMGSLTLDVGCGVLTHEERQAIWDAGQEASVGNTFTMRFFGYGVKDKPRFPRFVGWRDLDYM